MPGHETAFQELHERVQWCRGQQIVLKAEMLSFLDGAYSVTSEVADGGTTTVLATGLKPVPRSISIHSGTILNELRATLDGLACALAVMNGQGPEKVYFPICADAKAFAQDGRKKIAKLCGEHRDLIERLQPYVTGDNLLLGLHQADILRKHQRLMLASCAPAELGISEGVFEVFEMHEGAIPVGAAVPVVTYLSAIPPRFRIEFGVAFAEPAPFKGRQVLSILDRLCDRIERIVCHFSPVTRPPSS